MADFHAAVGEHVGLANGQFRLWTNDLRDSKPKRPSLCLSSFNSATSLEILQPVMPPYRFYLEHVEPLLDKEELKILHYYLDLFDGNDSSSSASSAPSAFGANEITSVDPLEAFLYQKGFVRFCSEKKTRVVWQLVLTK